MGRISQAEIAKKLGISRTTVTKALKDDPNISIHTKKKVKATAQELGYIVNNIGRNLVNNKTMTIGLIIPKIAHSFYSTLLEAIYNAANQEGYDIIPMVSFEDAEREKKMIENLLAMRVDGIILDISEKTKSLDTFDIMLKHNTPLIFLDRALTTRKHSQITTNDYEITRQIMEYAINKGYKRFGFFGGQLHLSSGIDRLEGYKQALNDHKIAIHEKWNVVGGYSKGFGFRNLMKLYEKGSLPQLIFCVSDEVALGVYQAAEDLNLVIPSDLAVIGFGDLEIAGYLQPPLTTVSMPIEKLAMAAVTTLIAEIENPDREKTKIKLEGNLKLRESL